MQTSTFRTLMSVGSALAATPLIRSISSASMPDPLAFVGLERQRSRALERAALVGAGLLVGAGAALLLAPASGEQTRRRIKAKADALVDDAKEVGERAAGYLQDAADATLKDVGLSTGTEKNEKNSTRSFSAHS